MAVTACMSHYGEMPDVDYKKLIKLLRRTYTHGDGGLPSESGITDHVLSRCSARGVYDHKNARILWNIGVSRLSLAQRKSCILHEQQTADHQG